MKKELDLNETLIANSNQLNAIDLFGGPLTIKITDVKEGPDAKQPVKIFYEGCNNRPYLPNLGFRRFLVKGWGVYDEKLGKPILRPENMVGKSLVLFLEPTVKWGGESVGGIRISHMSDIREDFTMSLIIARGKQIKYTMQKLVVGSVQKSLKELGEIEAKKGLESLRRWFESLSKPEQIEASSFKDELKKIASEVVV